MTDDTTRKDKLILDIQNLLNTYDNVTTTAINPALLEFMDEQTLINIISNLLEQKEEAKESDLVWLEKFKKEIQ
jgi:hypothetical protein